MLLASAGAAFAYWTTNGEATNNTAQTGTTTSWEVTVDNPSGDPLAPTTATGDPFQTVDFHIKNVDAGTLNINTVTLTVESTDKAGCDASWYAISEENKPSGPVASGATKDGDFELRLIDNNAPQNECKGAKVTVKVAVA